jgi:hypothetical protein
MNNTSITATGTGATSQVISLPDGIFNLFISSSGWGSTKIEVSPDGTNWFTLQDSGSDLSISSNYVTEINGGLILRLNVQTYSQNINAFTKRVI